MFGLGFKIVMCCLVAAFVSNAFAADKPLLHKSNRVYGGKSVNITDRPYLVQVRDSYFGTYVCCGTLVDRTHVVTAAHCLVGRDPIEDLVIVGGASTISDDGVRLKIVKSTVHPDYRKGHNYANDIAVFELESRMVGQYILPIRISYDDIKDEEFLTISGWGKTEEGITGTVKLIRTARVAKIPAQECEEKYSTYKGVTATMICAATPGKDACDGDSGGPAVYRGRLVAVVSWGKGCADSDYPGVYTSLKSVEDFLTKALE